MFSISVANAKVGIWNLSRIEHKSFKNGGPTSRQLLRLADPFPCWQLRTIKIYSYGSGDRVLFDQVLRRQWACVGGLLDDSLSMKHFSLGPRFISL